MATILIVDDRPANRDYLVTLLGYGGHRMLQAADGAEALALAKAERPHLVIADILMPTMDGYELVRQLRADPAIAATPVIFYTAHYHEREARALAQACGVSHVLSKPTDPEVILGTVDAALGMAPSPVPPPPAEQFGREHLRVLTDKLSQQAEELRRANERLTALAELSLDLGSERDARRLLQNFCHIARRIIGSRYAVVGVMGEDGLHLRHCFTSGMDAATASRLGAPEPRRGPLGTVLKEGRCCRLRNRGGDPADVGLSAAFPTTYALLGAPLISPTRAYGWLCLIDKLGAEEFSPEDERLAGILAAQVGRIYENGSLYADVLRHAAELEREMAERRRAEVALAERVRLASLVGDIGVALTQANTLKGILDLCAQALVRQLDAAFARIWTVNEPEQVLELQDSAGLYTHLDGPHSRVPVGKFKIGLIAQERKPHLTNDVCNDPRVGDRTWAEREGMVAFAGYPLLVGARPVGVMALFARQPLSTATIQSMAAVADQIALSIENKRAEEAVQHSEAQKAAILRGSLDAIITMDDKGTIRGFNPAAERVFGYAESEALGRALAELIIPASLREQHSQGLARYLATGQGPILEKRLEMPAIRADGGEFPAESSVTRISVEGRPMFTGYLRDITKRKQAERALREREERIRLLLDSTAEGIYGIDLQGRCVFANSACARLLGYADPDKFLGKNMHTLAHHTRADRTPYPEEECRIFQAFRKAQGSHVEDEVFWRADGSNFPVEYWSYPIRRAGQIMGAVVTFLDITERKRLEEQFRQSQKMEAIGRLAGGVAHDFNNLLTVINGYGSLVLERLPAGDPARELIREVVAAGDRAASLTRQLLAFSRKAIIEPKVLDLKALVADVDKMLRRILGEDIELAVATDPDLGAVKADPGQFEQLLLNLVVNARDAMPQGGKLTIEVRNAELDETYAHDHPDVRPGPYVLLAVSDTGCGMDAATMARVFEPFFTTKGEKGTGLGLATVHGIVKQSGGHVAVYSEVGRGTTFKVYLPRVDKGPRPAKAPRGPSELPRGTETVLLAEDADGVRALTRHILQACGYTVLEARDGAEALRLAGEPGVHIDLVVTDVVLPRVGGRELAERLIATHPGVKVLYLSGYTDDSVVRHGILAGEVAFLQKPFGPASLAAKVREVLDGG